jgi:hypothetical protein
MGMIRLKECRSAADVVAHARVVSARKRARLMPSLVPPPSSPPPFEPMARMSEAISGAGPVFEAPPAPACRFAHASYTLSFTTSIEFAPPLTASITPSLAPDWLPTSQQLPTPLLLERIRDEVAAKHELAVADLCCAGRQWLLVKARNEFCYRAAIESKASFAQIGKAIDRDHTTAMAATARYCQTGSLPYPRGAAWAGRAKYADPGGRWPLARVQALRRLRADGLSNAQIGVQLGCSAGAVGGAVTRFDLARRRSRRMRAMFERRTPKPQGTRP